jgi:hypothetical protein
MMEHSPAQKVGLASLFVFFVAAAFAQQPQLPANYPAGQYDESKVPKYSLPDPLVLLSGNKVKDAKTWKEKRRPEILRLFATSVYGRTMARPASVLKTCPRWKLPWETPSAITTGRERTASTTTIGNSSSISRTGTSARDKSRTRRYQPSQGDLSILQALLFHHVELRLDQIDGISAKHDSERARFYDATHVAIQVGQFVGA